MKINRTIVLNRHLYIVVFRVLLKIIGIHDILNDHYKNLIDELFITSNKDHDLHDSHEVIVANLVFVILYDDFL